MSVRIPPRATPRRLLVHERMRAARWASGLSQRDVARKLHVSSNTVCHWESGHRSPHVDMVDAYLRAVGASLVLGEDA